MSNWTYYNHAVIPTTAPHEIADTSEIESGAVWKRFPKALLARWTSDFDCGYDTGWWDCIRFAPYLREEASAKERKSIRQAHGKSYAVRIDPAKYRQELAECFLFAYERYEKVDYRFSKDAFSERCVRAAEDPTQDVWAAFTANENRLIGFVFVKKHAEYVEFTTSKFDPRYFSAQGSDVLYDTVLDHYLNHEGFRYVNSGSRSINHETGTQEYKERRFGYRKAFGVLHIRYRPGIGFLVKLVYPFRKILRKLDGIGTFHRFNAVLRMEEIVRADRKKNGKRS